MIYSPEVFVFSSGDRGIIGMIPNASYSHNAKANPVQRDCFFNSHPLMKA